VTGLIFRGLGDVRRGTYHREDDGGENKDGRLDWWALKEAWSEDVERRCKASKVLCCAVVPNLNPTTTSVRVSGCSRAAVLELLFKVFQVW